MEQSLLESINGGEVMSFMSPAEVEISIKRAERRFSSALSTRSSIWVLIAVIGICALFFFIEKTLLQNGTHYSRNGGFYVLYLARRSLFTAILLSPILIFIKERFQVLAQVLCFLGVWATALRTYAPLVDNHLFTLISLSLPTLTLFCWAYVRYFSQGNFPKFRALLFSLIFWLFLSAIMYSIYAQGDEMSLRIFLQIKLGFIWLAALTFGGASHSSEDARAFLNPINAIRGEIWPNGSRLSEANPEVRKKIWWLGFSNLIISAFVFTLRMLSESLLLKNSPGPYFHELNHYLMAILAIIGFLNLVTGIGRMYGFDLRDATNFVWLARTPAEYWRRGSVYHYTFILKYIYLPLYRLIRTRFIASSIAFLIFMINKNGFITSFFFIADICGHPFNNNIYRPSVAHSTLCLWLLWYIVLVITRRFWFVNGSKQNHSVYGWVSIFLTHFLMSNLYYFAHLLRDWLW